MLITLLKEPSSRLGVLLGSDTMKYQSGQVVDFTVVGDLAQIDGGLGRVPWFLKLWLAERRG